jgi:polyferredoxin
MVAMAEGKSGSTVASLVRWRSWVQAAFLLVWLSPWLRLHTVCSPVFHCHSCPLATFACPIGVLANFSAYHAVSFVAIGTLVIYASVFGSLVCGWVCPFGFLQDLVGRIPTPKFELPAWMGHLRYVVLVVLVLAIPFLFGLEHPLFFCRLCPAGALEAALPYTASLAIAGEEVTWPSAAKLTILILVLTAMLFKRRPWCTLFCPLGAIYGLFNRVSVFFLEFHPERCHDCKLCDGLCPCRGASERRASPQRCVRCLDCIKCSAITVESVFGRQNAAGGEGGTDE